LHIIWRSNNYTLFPYTTLFRSEEVTHLINSNELSMGHARALLGLKNKDNTISVANKIVTEKLNVRQVEQLITKLNEAKPSKQQKDRKSTRLNSSHVSISYAVFC